MHKANIRTLRSTSLLNPDQAEQTIFRFGAARLDVGAPGAAQPPLAANLILITPDEAGDGIGLAPGNPTVTVDAANSTIGTIGTIGDQDYYTVNLVAGTTYEIGLFGYYPGGPNLFPLSDAYVELYSASGQLLGSADGGASTDLNLVNSGFDALLTFTATTTGTYYVNARAFDQDPVNGTKGDFVGDYELSVNAVDPNDPDIYHPYYEASSPLYAIDWGTQVNRVNQSARNPDGNEGPRDTGNAQGTPDYNVNDIPGLDIAALAAAQGKDIAGKNVITIYFAKAGDLFTSIEDPTSPGLPPVLVSLGTEQFEKDTVWTALHEFEKVADIVYLEVPTRDQADFFFTTYAGTPGPGASLLGSMSPPDYPDEGLAQFNSNDERWTEANLAQGGFSFVTLIHEFGHGHGLAHPHDNGGHSGIMNGVESEGVVADYTTGAFDLNQGVFTMMSYEDGWQTSPYGNAETDAGYGWLGGLMAFDIAAIQDKYGVNEDWAAGNDVYVLKDENAAGTFYYSIWDTGGTDSIVYSGSRNAHIDLRAATLQYEEGGGGRVSYAFGIYGGFTIANGVIIENATAGGGADTLIGNAENNFLDGSGGADILNGLGGDDAIIVDNAGDQVVEASGGGNDLVAASTSYALNAGAEVETVSTTNAAGFAAIALTGNEFGQTIIGNAGNNFLYGGGGADILNGGAGDDVIIVDADDQVVEATGGGNDLVAALASYALNAGAEVEILSTINGGSNAAIALTGNEFGQLLLGNAGNNFLYGFGGADILNGGAGDDVIIVDADDQVVEATGGGNDLVASVSNYVLNAGAEVEILSTTNGGGNATIALTGNEYGQTIIGNAGNNFLYGLGGADILDGGAGNDVIIVDGDDLVIEAAGGDNDLVAALTSYTLNAGAEVETLSTTNGGGNAAIALTGNAFGQTIIGNAGSNVLNGGGGADSLQGQGGADTFAFTTALGGGNVDAILDFAAGSDRIALDDAVFTQIGGLGALNANAFVTGTAAADANDRIIYNSATGQLFYDADGIGGTAAVLFATLQGNPVLAASDFVVI
jgi:Ca2+-binding RTX toxin-like protein